MRNSEVDVTEEEKIKARLANVEMALIGLWDAVRELMPPEVQADCGEMMQDFFNSSDELGGF